MYHGGGELQLYLWTVLTKCGTKFITYELGLMTQFNYLQIGAGFLSFPRNYLPPGFSLLI